MIDHVIFSFVTQAFECQHCGGQHAPTLPLPVEQFVSIGKGFMLMHRHCVKAQPPSPQLPLPHTGGIDGMRDDPDPETDPPGHDETDADGKPLPPPHYAHLAGDEALRQKFLQHYPWPKDSFQLRADLAIVLQRIEGSELPSAATVNGWDPSTVRFQKAAGWVRDELADMNRKEHPEFDPFLPLERQPMPAELAALCLPVKKPKKGARPLTSGKKRKAE